MHEATQAYIANNWERLLEPGVSEKTFERTPLRIPFAIVSLLQQGPLTTQEIAEQLHLNLNTVRIITRMLDGKLFERGKTSPIVGSSKQVWLHPFVIEQLSKQPESTSKNDLPLKQLKVIAKLPEKEFYQPIQSNSQGKWLFEDKQSSIFRIVSPERSPWAKEWEIVFSFQKGKSDNSLWPYRLDLRLYRGEKQNQSPKAMIVREEIKGSFVWSTEGAAMFFAAPTSTERIWIAYSVYLI